MHLTYALDKQAAQAVADKNHRAVAENSLYAIKGLSRAQTRGMLGMG